jgi:hypothetical protein
MLAKLWSKAENAMAEHESSQETPVEVLPREALNADRMTLLLRTRPENMTPAQLAEAIAILRAIAGVARRRDGQLSSFLKESDFFKRIPADERGHKRAEAGEVVLILERRPALGERPRRIKRIQRGPLPAGAMKVPELLNHLKKVLSPEDLGRCTELVIIPERLEALVKLGALEAANLEPFFEPVEDALEVQERAPIFALKLGPRGDLEGLLRSIEGLEPANDDQQLAE